MYLHSNDESRNLMWTNMAKKIDHNNYDELIRCICLCPDAMLNSKLFIFLLGKVQAFHIIALPGMDKQYQVDQDSYNKICRMDAIHTNNVYNLYNSILENY